MRVQRPLAPVKGRERGGGRWGCEMGNSLKTRNYDKVHKAKLQGREGGWALKGLERNGWRAWVGLQEDQKRSG